LSWEALLGSLPGATQVERRGDGLWMAAPALDVLAMAELMRRLEARLSAMTGLALSGGETGVLYHYCLGGLRINIRTETHNRTIPSITPITRAADWSEREIADLYGVDVAGHPNLARLIRPPSLPAGFFRNPSDGGRRG
jgi:NADH:ubiquinone oxidoreductase subunit C